MQIKGTICILWQELEFYCREWFPERLASCRFKPTCFLPVRGVAGTRVPGVDPRVPGLGKVDARADSKLDREEGAEVADPMGGGSILIVSWAARLFWGGSWIVVAHGWRSMEGLGPLGLVPGGGLDPLGLVGPLGCCGHETLGVWGDRCSGARSCSSSGSELLGGPSTFFRIDFFLIWFALGEGWITGWTGVVEPLLPLPETWSRSTYNTDGYHTMAESERKRKEWKKNHKKSILKIWNKQ